MRLRVSALSLSLSVLACAGEPGEPEPPPMVESTHHPQVAPGQPVRLLALGDTGEGNDAQRAVAEQMAATCQALGGCTAALMLGDNIYDQGVQGPDDPQWVTKFEWAYDIPELLPLPFYATLGNHDYGLTSRGSADAQIAYAALPLGEGPGERRSAQFHMPARYYDVRLGDVHIFGVDTQDGSVAQTMAMRDAVESSDATWKIVFGHHPRFTAGDHNRDNWAVDLATDYYAMLEQVYCGADLLLSGHDHNMEFIEAGRDERCPDTHFAISGAGSKNRLSRGVVRPEDGPGEYQRFYDERAPGFALLEVEGDTLQFSFIDTQGTRLFEIELRK